MNCKGCNTPLAPYELKEDKCHACTYRELMLTNQRVIRMTQALLEAIGNCGWCGGTGQDNDGEGLVSEDCPHCRHLRNAIT